MPKPKLSDAEKSALREELKKRLAGGQTASKVQQELGAKFKVSPETVRYHGKQLAERDGAAKRKRAKPGRKPQGVRKAKRALAPSTDLRGLIRRYDPQALERAAKASKLLRELQAERERSTNLQVELRTSKRVAAKLDRQIKKLVRP